MTNARFAADLRPGDLVDVASDPIAHAIMTDVDIHCAEFELATVCERHRAPDGGTFIGFEGFGGLAHYPPLAVVAPEQ